MSKEDKSPVDRLAGNPLEEIASDANMARLDNITNELSDSIGSTLDRHSHDAPLNFLEGQATIAYAAARVITQCCMDPLSEDMQARVREIFDEAMHATLKEWRLRRAEEDVEKALDKIVGTSKGG